MLLDNNKHYRRKIFFKPEDALDLLINRFYIFLLYLEDNLYHTPYNFNCLQNLIINTRIIIIFFLVEILFNAS